MSDKYDDIINLPHHVSRKHPPMSLHNRAAQFAPFAALTGFGAEIMEAARLTSELINMSEDAKAILDLKLQMIQDNISAHPQVTITYFEPDTIKHGGSYHTIVDGIKEIDEYKREFVLLSGERIPVDYVTDLQSELFGELM